MLFLIHMLEFVKYVRPYTYTIFDNGLNSVCHMHILTYKAPIPESM